MRAYLAVALLAFFLAGMSISTGAFSLADVSRFGQFGVASDSNALLSLWVNETVQNCERQDLVEVTNEFEGDLDEVTVSLNDGSIGTLHADGDSGDLVTFSLPIGASQMVEIEADHSAPPATPFSFSFDITGSGGSTFVEAHRSSTMEGEGNCGGGPPGGGGGPP